jgi:hypothetical protein
MPPLAPTSTPSAATGAHLNAECRHWRASQRRFPLQSSCSFGSRVWITCLDHV